MIKFILVIYIAFFGLASYAKSHQQEKNVPLSLCQSISSPKTLVNPVNSLELNWRCLEKTLKQDHVSMQKDPEAFYETVKKIVLPMIAVDHMAGLTLGPKWREATKQERTIFINEFGYMLMRSYAVALLRVSDYVVKFNPLRDSSWQKDNYVQVNGRVVAKSNNIGSTITYYLERSGNNWKIYDVSIEGVSFVKNFAAQFREYSSMKQLLEKLQAVNKRKGA